jgi:Tfp pilus assembly protein PilN
MLRINLLPAEYAASSPIRKTADVFKQIAIAGFSLLILFLIASGIYLFFLNAQVRSSLASQEELKNSIKSLEQTEQRLVLVKDRVAKVKTVLGKKTVDSSIADLKSLTVNLPEDVTVSEADVTPQITEITFSARSSSGLVKLMSNLVLLDSYKRIELKSFSFTPTLGYRVTFKLTE